MGVYSDGSYGAPKEIIYSFPVTCKDGKWEIVQASVREIGLSGGGRGGFIEWGVLA